VERTLCIAFVVVLCNRKRKLVSKEGKRRLKKNVMLHVFRVLVQKRGEQEKETKHTTQMCTF